MNRPAIVNPHSKQTSNERQGGLTWEERIQTHRYILFINQHESIS